jgi:hypothetical protein
MLHKPLSSLSLSKKRKEEEKRPPKGILRYCTTFPAAGKDTWGISGGKYTDENTKKHKMALTN